MACLFCALHMCLMLRCSGWMLPHAGAGVVAFSASQFFFCFPWPPVDYVLENALVCLWISSNISLRASVLRAVSAGLVSFSLEWRGCGVPRGVRPGGCKVLSPSAVDAAQ